jgi:hypothetical protein
MKESLFMQRTLILALIVASSALAQPETHVFVTGGGFGFQARVPAAPVQGAPYSATITNESIQTLADGNRIVESSTGTTARDSMGRTRQDAPLPSIANLSPADAPHIVLIQDPVARASYTLNLTDKTAMKGPASAGIAVADSTATITAAGGAMISKSMAGPVTSIAVPALPMTLQRADIAEKGQAQTEDLGSKTMEGVTVTGTRVTRTIPAGQIGNDRPISIVTEVWTSPDLKTIVYSKRSDPRMGDQTFELTNIVRAEPDPLLFIVPSDFKMLDAPEPILYRTSGGPAQ